MNHKDFVRELSRRLKISQKSTTIGLKLIVEKTRNNLIKGNCVDFLQIGTLQVSIRDQRIIFNPKTKQKMLHPPKLTLGFTPSKSAKKEIKEAADE